VTKEDEDEALRLKGEANKAFAGTSSPAQRYFLPRRRRSADAPDAYIAPGSQGLCRSD
jgi:hypothetical protein